MSDSLRTKVKIEVQLRFESLPGEAPHTREEMANLIHVMHGHERNLKQAARMMERRIADDLRRRNL